MLGSCENNLTTMRLRPTTPLEGAAISASAITWPCSGWSPTAWVSRPEAGAASDPRRRCGAFSRVRVGEPAGPPPG